MRGLHAVRAALLAAGLALGAQAVAGEAIEIKAPKVTPVNLAEWDAARMPSGLASLCKRDPSECQPIPPASRELAFTSQLWKLVTGVNTSVNRSITATTDRQLYGVEEYWTLPDKAGDCEDFVLLKRKLLAERGLPRASLLITVVQDENGEGHAVLTIPTTAGDLVLDNRRDQVLHWQATGYTFVKRQSAANPNAWVYLQRERLQATNVIASGPEAPHTK